MDNNTVNDIYDGKVLLQGDNIDIIIENAIKDGMFVNQDGNAI